MPQGLNIQALATGLEHPRSLYVLPNGDVLVVESEGAGRALSQAAQGHRHGLDGIQGHLGRQTRAEQPDHAAARHQWRRRAGVRSVFLDHLNSPFGVALVGNDLYVANTDAIVRYPYTDGRHQYHRARHDR